jgi:transcriptional regulator with XRE-family HTH domain
MWFMNTNYPQALNQAVADELRAYRTAARMTQADVTRITGISKSKIIKLEDARIDIGTRDIALYTEAVGAEPRELMQRAQDRAAKAI